MLLINFLYFKIFFLKIIHFIFGCSLYFVQLLFKIIQKISENKKQLKYAFRKYLIFGKP